MIDAKIPIIAGALDDKGRQHISDHLKKMNNRTYLWLYLILDIIEGSIASLRRESSIIAILSGLPSKVSEAYERILDKSSNKTDARTLLRIILAATRPLSLMEVNIALALANQQVCTSHKTLDLWPVQNFKADVQNLCGLFVSFYDGKLSLIHQTAREFLLQNHNTEVGNCPPKKWQGCFDLATAHSTMSKVCLDYLNFDEFHIPISTKEFKNRIRCHNIGGFEGKNESYPLFEYAAGSWAAHYNSQTSESAKELLTAALKPCNNPWSNTIDWLQVSLSSSFAGILFVEYNNLEIASLFGLTQVVETLLNKEKNFNSLACRCAALRLASYTGHAEVVQMLLDKGADINARGEGGTALQIASNGGHEEVVRLLLDHGVDINPKEEELTALQLASYIGHAKIVQMLLENWPINIHENGKETALHKASSRGHEEIVRILLKNGADINANKRYNESALRTASWGGYDKVVQILLDHGADVNAKNTNHESALQKASFGGHEKVVQILLERGAKVNAQNRDQESALQIASLQGHEKVVEILLENGADVNGQDDICESALQSASARGHEKVVQVLLEYKADVNAKNIRHESALLLASSQGHEKVVQILRKHGADLSQKDLQGRTPLHLASARGQKAIVEILSSAESGPTALDKQGRNCLHHAACGGFAELVSWLIEEKRFDPNAADRDGWTALHWAAKNGSLDTVQVLIGAGAKSTIESIKGWTPHSVAVFHQNSLDILDVVPISSKSAESELLTTTTQSMEASTAVVESTSPGEWQGLSCDGCSLVSFIHPKHSFSSVEYLLL